MTNDDLDEFHSRSTIIGTGSSESTVSHLGAYVQTLTLNGHRIVKPTGDGNQTHGGIAVLMPYADKVEKGRYTFEGKDYQLPLNEDGEAIHGFAKDRIWRVKKGGKRSITLTTVVKDKGYPGKLAAEVTYSISRRSFSTSCSVANAGKVNCPVVIGFHPYFLGTSWKLSGKSKAYRYLLRDRYFPTGAREPSSFDEVGPYADLDDSFSVAGPVSFQGEGYQVTIKRRAMPYLIIYNGEHAEGKSVAIEPYTGLTDAYNNGMGLRVLKPGHSFKCGYDVTLTSRSAGIS